MKRAYFAHSKLSYGSQTEKEARKYLEGKFKVICPNRDLGELGSIQPYLEKIDTCSVVVAMEHKKHIGKGVYDELHHAIAERKETYVLRKFNDSFVLRVIKVLNIVDPDDWKLNYGTLETVEEASCGRK